MLADYDKAHNDKPAESMDVPIQMFDWRLLVVIGGFVVLILIVSKLAGTYEYAIPFSFILVALFFIFVHAKVSVGSETMRIRTPILGDTIIPKNSVKKIEIFENYGNRHKLRSLVSIAVMVIISINLAFTMQNPVMNKLFILVALVFVYVLYFTVRISNYPEMIRMSAGKREILLYPRNEHDFLILKGIVPDKSD